jgi:hypothetical protein
VIDAHSVLYLAIIADLHAKINVHIFAQNAVLANDHVLAHLDVVPDAGPLTDLRLG